MASLYKEEMKQAKIHLKNEQWAEVIEVLKPMLVQEIDDYMLYCITGKAYFHLEKFDQSFHVLKKAVKLDPDNITAWKGLFQLFESNTNGNATEFLLEVCQVIINKETNPEKQESARQVYTRLLYEMLKFEDLFKLFENDMVNMKKLLIFVMKRKMVEDDYQFVQKIFTTMKSTNFLENDQETMLIYCKFLENAKKPAELFEMIEILVEKWPENLENDDVQRKIFQKSCEIYFETGKFPKIAEKVTENATSASTFKIFTALRSNDITTALETLDTKQQKCVFPDALLYVGLLGESENWLECQKIVKYIESTKSEASNICKGWLARIALESEIEDVKGIGRICDEPVLGEFAMEEVKLALIQEDEEMLEKLREKAGDDGRVRLITALHTNTITQDDIKLIDNLPQTDWKSLLLAAEVRIAANLDATSFLVKAAKLNPRSSRVFFILGSSLISKNPSKAKSCLERALKIQPGNEKYAEKYDEVLEKQGETSEERLESLKKLVQARGARRKSLWLLETLSKLYLETDKLDNAVEELQTLVRLQKDNKLAWARLAQVYFKKGHLRAAVNSYTQLAELENGYSYIIPTIRVLVQLREFEAAMEKVEEYRGKTADISDLPEGSDFAIDYLEAQIRLNLHSSARGIEKREHLKMALKLLSKCVEKKCEFSIVYKLIGDALLMVHKYAERFLSYFEIDPNWNITDRLSAAKMSVAFYSVVVRMRADDVLAWHDMSVAILSQFKIDKDAELLVKVESFLKNALKLTHDELILSTIWTLLAETLRLAEKPAAHQLHCLTRALQLNKTNDSAWLKLGLLCIEETEMVMASNAIELAIKYNPHNADAWCLWSVHAHLMGTSYDAESMFRQTLCIQPTTTAVVGYCTYLCESLQKSHDRFSSAVLAIDFEPVIDLRETANCDNKTTMYYLGLLADLFGYYKESLECYQLSEYYGEEVERVMMKVKILHPETDIQLRDEIFPENQRLHSMLIRSLEDNYAILKDEVQIYGRLFNAIEANDHQSFRELYIATVKNLSIPLFVSTLIANDITLPDEFVATIHEALPRHELIDFFPVVPPAGVDDGLRGLEQDGEEPFRYKNRVAKDVLDLLKSIREKKEVVV